MHRTTIYLPAGLKARLERVARTEGRTEADVIREALGTALEARARPRPHVPLTGHGLGDPSASERADELLGGFGRT